ncbi:MAG: hypothetical protein JKY71_05575 [Alphaproteobacteria bacterium]|nr:hypothetical protein [Alphaproteobacteria bacterium]
MSFERTKASFCALFLLAGCSNGARLTDRPWDEILSQGAREEHRSCQKVSITGSPGYYTCDDDQQAEPYIDHLFN